MSQTVRDYWRFNLDKRRSRRRRSIASSGCGIRSEDLQAELKNEASSPAPTGL